MHTLHCDIPIRINHSCYIWRPTVIYRVLPTLCFIVLFMSPPIYLLAKKGWLPVTDHMKNRVEVAKARERKEEEKRQREKHKQVNACCSCCSCLKAIKYRDIENGGLPITENN